MAPPRASTEERPEAEAQWILSGTKKGTLPISLEKRPCGKKVCALVCLESDASVSLATFLKVNYKQLLLLHVSV